MMTSIDFADLASRVEAHVKDALSPDFVGDYLYQRSWTPATEKVKDLFAKLGKQMGYDVKPNGKSDLASEENSFDLTWERNSKTGILEDVILALECEWHIGKTEAADVDRDFKKLVRTRARLRVWVAAISNPELAGQHIDSCKKQARAFALAEDGDSYLLIVFIWGPEYELRLESFTLPGQL
jgi:hypothetical protein